MNNKQFDKDYRSISVIDDLIMELSLIKSGNKPSVEKLEQGIELIEHLMTRLNKPGKEPSPEKSGISPLQPKTSTYTGSYELHATKEELEGLKQFIQKSIESSENIEKEEIESFQDQLLKLSLPIWKNQVSALTQSHFKQIEL